MGMLVVILVVALPVVELYLAVEVARLVGAAETVALLLVISIGGAWLARRQGLAVLARVREKLNAGEIPGRDLVHGLLVLIAGLLLLVPGFLTDAVGLLLLLPPVRSGAQLLLFRRWRRRVQRVSSTWTVVSTGRETSSADGSDRRPPPGALPPGPPGSPPQEDPGGPP
ncbi:MAG: FxsA family protein [Acidimicrobiia bacterium]